VFWGKGKKKEGQSGTVHAIGAFGKLPHLGDFVRVGAVTSSPSFETWLEGGMAWGEARRGSDWSSRYGAGSIYAFVHKGGERHLTTGVIKPSRDRVDRRFPLVVFSQLPEKLPAAPHLLPLFLGNFLDAAAQILLDAEHFTTSAELAARLGNLPPIEFDGFAHDYYSWARQTSVASVCPALYGDPADSGVAALGAALDDILDALGAARGQESPTTSLGVRLPLGAGGSASATFWLDAVRRAARWVTNVPSCFWSFDGNSGSILIQLGKTPPSSLSELWAPDPDSESICDLLAPKTNSSHRTSTVATRMVRGDIPIGDVLDALERG
jgi:type VI secretion system protein ImpM